MHGICLYGTHNAWRLSLLCTGRTFALLLFVRDSVLKLPCCGQCDCTICSCTSEILSLSLVLACARAGFLQARSCGMRLARRCLLSLQTIPLQPHVKAVLSLLVTTLLSSKVQTLLSKAHRVLSSIHPHLVHEAYLLKVHTVLALYVYLQEVGCAIHAYRSWPYFVQTCLACTCAGNARLSGALVYAVSADVPRLGTSMISPRQLNSLLCMHTHLCCICLRVVGKQRRISSSADAGLLTGSTPTP